MGKWYIHGPKHHKGDQPWNLNLARHIRTEKIRKSKIILEDEVGFRIKKHQAGLFTEESSILEIVKRFVLGTGWP